MKRDIVSYSKGFTIIELLVVITIIGLLASIVISNLDSSRYKAQDARIKEQMSSIRNIASLLNTGSSYGKVSTTAYDCGDLFLSDPRMILIFDKTSWPDDNSPKCVSDGTAVGDPINKWAATHPLMTNPAKYFCVDSSGGATILTAAFNTALLADHKDCSGNVMSMTVEP